jgi:hypothetical protein
MLLPSDELQQNVQIAIGTGGNGSKSLRYDRPRLAKRQLRDFSQGSAGCWRRDSDASLAPASTLTIEVEWMTQLESARARGCVMATKVRLVAMSKETGYAPLGVLGYCLSRSDFLAPVWAGLEHPMKQVEHAPAEKLQDVVVSILTGCRGIAQINTRLRPDVALAQAWGRERFAEQSTIARTLDAMAQLQVNQLRQGVMALFRRESGVFGHDFTKQWLWLDIDLTPLPVSKHAEGATKGKFAKKTAMDGSWHASMRRNIMKRFFRISFLAGRKVAPLTSLSSKPWNAGLTLRRLRRNAAFCAVMAALAASRMPMLLCAQVGRFWPRAKEDCARKPLRVAWHLKPGRIWGNNAGRPLCPTPLVMCARLNNSCCIG